MNTLNDYIQTYLENCKYRKRLDVKTLKAYTIDLKQYMNYCTSFPTNDYYSRNTMEQFITFLHKQYKPKTVKRKSACLKAFFHYLEYIEVLSVNPSQN